MASEVVDRAGWAQRAARDAGQRYVRAAGVRASPGTTDLLRRGIDGQLA